MLLSLLLVADTVRTLCEIYKANAFRKRGKGFKELMNPVPEDLGALNGIQIFLCLEGVNGPLTMCHFFKWQGLYRAQITKC